MLHTSVDREQETERFTRQLIHDTLQEEWESDLPDKVLEALRAFDGKPITTRMLAKLPEGHTWHLRRQYGMTHLVNDAYIREDYSKGLNLLLCHTESSVPLDIRQVEERNPAYFAGRRERNHSRMEAMNTREDLDRMARVLNQVHCAIAELDAATRELEKLTGYGKRFAADQYTWERLAGLRTEKGERRYAGK